MTLLVLIIASHAVQYKLICCGCKVIDLVDVKARLDFIRIILWNANTVTQNNTFVCCSGCCFESKVGLFRCDSSSSSGDHGALLPPV